MISENFPILRVRGAQKVSTEAAPGPDGASSAQPQQSPSVAWLGTGGKSSQGFTQTPAGTLLATSSFSFLPFFFFGMTARYVISCDFLYCLPGPRLPTLTPSSQVECIENV